jgi:hypothetical protein
MNSSKTAILATQARQKLDSLVGWFLAGFGGLGAAGLIAQIKEKGFNIGAFVFALVLAALGVWLILKARKTKDLVKNFKNYVQLLAGDPENSLENLAGATNSSVDEVKKNLREMIKRKFFANASIDEKNNRLVIRRSNDMQQIIANSEAAARPVQQTTVKCPGCGATMAVEVGKVVPCDYCGTMLKG